MSSTRKLNVISEKMKTLDRIFEKKSFSYSFFVIDGKKNWYALQVEALYILCII